MLRLLGDALVPAGLLLVGAGLVSLMFSERLAHLDSLLVLARRPKPDLKRSQRWVEISGAAWGALGVALLYAERLLG